MQWTLLSFYPRQPRPLVARVVKSAASNAEEEIFARPTDLTITKIYANEGPRLKRFRARARGRATQIIKRSSHITVVVDENEEL